MFCHFRQCRNCYFFTNVLGVWNGPYIPVFRFDSLGSFCLTSVQFSNPTSASSSPLSFPPQFHLVHPSHMTWTVSDLVQPVVHHTWHKYLHSQQSLGICRHIMHVLNTPLWEGLEQGLSHKQHVLSLEMEAFETFESSDLYLETIATRLATIEHYLEQNRAAVFQFIQQTLCSDPRKSDPQPSGCDAEQCVHCAQGRNIKADINRNMLDTLLCQEFSTDQTQ